MKNFIRINLDEVLDRIYAESAWRTAYRNDLYTLTPDNERMLVLKVQQGFHELLARLSGYVESWNYNPNIEQDNIMLVLKPDGQPDSGTLRASIIEALAQYALLQFYGEAETYHGTAWRRQRAHVMLLMCRPTP